MICGLRFRKKAFRGSCSSWFMISKPCSTSWKKYRNIKVGYIGYNTLGTPWAWLGQFTAHCTTQRSARRKRKTKNKMDWHAPGRLKETEDITFTDNFSFIVSQHTMVYYVSLWASILWYIMYPCEPAYCGILCILVSQQHTVVYVTGIF